MSLELLTQADYVLNSCGRPVPPKGFKFVDLSKIIAFHHTPQATGGAGGSYCYIAENGGVAFQNISPYTVTIIITEGVGPIITVSGGPVAGYTIKIVDGAEGGATITHFLNAWALVPMATSLVAATIAGGPTGGVLPCPGTATGEPDSTPFYEGPLNTTLAPGASTFTEGWPSQNYLSNNSNTLFLCWGVMLQTDPVSVRLKWPNGRYWNQFPSGNPFLSAGACFPQGTGGNLYALDEEMAIEKGSKVAIEMSGPNVGNVDVHLWGVLRYLLKDNGPSSFASTDGKTCIVGYPTQAQSQGAPACLVGYPVAGIPGSGSALIKTIPDPIQVLKYRRRFHCWPNGNIFAPEFRLGNQCETDTPPGCRDESYTFFSAPIVVPGGGQNYSNPVAVPGQDDVVIRRWRASIVWNDGSTGTPVVQIRLPNGYSVTGGDQIPLNLGYWMPMFPTLRVATGTSFFLDVSDSLAGDGGSITVTFEFDAVKRRKLAAA